MRETMRSVRIGCAAVIGALVTLMVLYPGFMSIDSAVALSEGRTWSFSDLHPPVLALIWRYVDVVVPGPFGMLIAQVAVFWAGLRLIAERLEVRSDTRRILFMLIVGFVPPVFSILGAIWKDVVMAALLVLAFGLAGRSSIFWPVVLLATATRHNAVFAIFPVIVFHLTARRSLPRALLLGAGATVLVIVTITAATRALPVRREHAVQFFVLMDVVGVALRENQLPNVESCFLKREPLTLAAAQASYSATHSLTLIQEDAPFRQCFEGGAVRELIREWMRSIAASPLTYLAHRSTVFGYVIGWSQTPSDYLMTQTTLRPEWFPALEVLPGPSRLQMLLDRCLRAIEGLGIFRPWPYLVLAAACVGWAALRGVRLPLFLATSGLLHEMALFFIAPGSDYRYSRARVHLIVIDSRPTRRHGPRR